MSTRARIAILAAAVFAATALAPALAQTSSQAQAAAEAARNARDAAAPHGLFGVITKLNTPKFTLRTVAGTYVHVDASQAIQSGDYSAPLSRGKRVLVLGSNGPAGVFEAVSVKRVDSLRGMASY